jgi:hypothetical protein
MLVFGVVFVLIGVTLIVEPPGQVGDLVLAAVLVIMLLVILRERRKPR